MYHSKFIESIQKEESGSAQHSLELAVYAENSKPCKFRADVTQWLHLQQIVQVSCWW